MSMDRIMETPRLRARQHPSGVRNQKVHVPPIEPGDPHKKGFWIVLVRSANETQELGERGARGETGQGTLLGFGLRSFHQYRASDRPTIMNERLALIAYTKNPPSVSHRDEGGKGLTSTGYINAQLLTPARLPHKNGIRPFGSQLLAQSGTLPWTNSSSLTFVRPSICRITSYSAKYSAVPRVSRIKCKFHPM